MSNNIWKILDFAIKKQASDIHISEWKPITIRVDWNLIILTEAWKITNDVIKKYTEELFNWNEFQIKNFYETHDVDFSYIDENNNAFRVNWFMRLWKISFVLRLINSSIKSMEELWLPKYVSKFTHLKQWLVLITWPTWSGKSTTMISILDEINKTRWEHIITIEDPIEFIFTDNKSIFSQRELWRDTDSFKKALKWAMREDPNIIMIWEMRDEETVRAALELAETWHLVISTLHTASSVQTINRLVSFFPSEVQNSVKDKLADTLQWVLSQRLIQKADNSWRIWIYELMFMTTWIKNLIRTWKFEQIQWNIETGSKYWMITMEKYAELLKNKWIVNEESYINYFKKDEV